MVFLGLVAILSGWLREIWRELHLCEIWMRDSGVLEIWG